MEHTLTLQLARFGDAEIIARLSRTSIEHGLPHVWTSRRIIRAIRHRETIVLTAKSASDLLGFAIMQFGDSSAHLNLLAVQPHARRRGIGRQLIGWLHESAKTLGTFVIDLELRVDNHVARRFYASLGYVEHGRVPFYYNDREDALRMRIDLSAAASLQPKSGN